MPDSNSSTRVFFRLNNELVEALDALLPSLREESMGEIRDRSKAARYLLTEAIHERQKRIQRENLMDHALQSMVQAAFPPQGKQDREKKPFTPNQEVEPIS